MFRAFWLLLGLAAPAFAQDAALRFEVASVKPNRTGSQGGSLPKTSPDRFKAENVTLELMIQWVWELRNFQITGLPPWARSDRFDINAIAGAAVTGEQKKTMVRSLLEDRFQLRFHSETRQMPVFEMIAAKGGLKLVKTNCVPDPNKPETNCGDVNLSANGLHATGISMERLAGVLGDILQRTVIDRTEFTERFDVDVDWRPDESTPGYFVLTGQPPQSGPDSGSPSIFTALENKLGLKLQSGKGPVEMLVVDRAEPFAEN